MRRIVLTIALLSLVSGAASRSRDRPVHRASKVRKDQQVLKVMLARRGLPDRRVQRATPVRNCVSWRARRRSPARKAKPWCR
jgi:hypothetical protein